MDEDQAAGEAPAPTAAPTTPGCAAVHGGAVGPYLDALNARIKKLEDDDQNGDGQLAGNATIGNG